MPCEGLKGTINGIGETEQGRQLQSVTRSPDDATGLSGGLFYLNRLEVRNMVKIQEQEQTTEVFENDIDLYLKLFCEEQDIEDLRTASQSVWNAALMYIKRHVFNNNNILKSNKPLDGYINNNYNNKYNNLNNSNCNSYDIDIVNSICDYYIYICMMYDKEVSINGFTFLTGISQDCIYAWGNNARELSTSGNEIYKKLNRYREESLSAKLATANKNPVGVLAILNRHYQWNMPGVSREQASKRALSAAELPKLGEAKSLNVVSDSD